MLEKVNMKDWNRKQHFDFFNKFDYPHFNITVDLEISGLKKYTKRNNISFLKSMVFLVTKSANEIKEFKYRIIDDNQVVILEKVNPAFTIMSDDNLFSFCNSVYYENKEKFFKNMDKSIRKYKQNPVVSGKADKMDYIYMTSLPWINFNSITHPINIKNVDSVPRIAWGKYCKEGNKISIPFSIQVHHALMDGYHVAKYINNLKNKLENPQKYL